MAQSEKALSSGALSFDESSYRGLRTAPISQGGQALGQAGGFAQAGIGATGGAFSGGGLLRSAEVASSGDGLFAAVNSDRLTAAAAFRPPSAAGGAEWERVDLTVANVEVTQAIQRPNNSVGLVAGKATMVRVTVGLSGSATPIPDVRGELYVYQGSREVAGMPFYPINNGITARPAPNRAAENDTLNFLLPPLSGDVTLIPVVYAWGSEETDWWDNVAYLSGLDFNCRRSPSIAYLPTDYRPGGGATPNLPNPALIRPGVGDAFLRAIYPIPNVNYFQVSGAPLLWTQNINTSTSAYFNALNQRRQMTAPMPDLLYGWLPGNPFDGNGASIINGRVAFGNTDPSRYIRTFAHEVGHNFGLQHNGRRLTPDVGVDVNNSIGLGRIKAPTLGDIMVGGQLTHEAFVDVESYTHFYNHPWTQCGAGPGGAPGGVAGDYLFVTGLIDETGRATLNPTYRLEGPAAYSQPDPEGEYLLRVHTTQGDVRELRFAASTGAGNGHDPSCSCAACTGAAFALVIPNDPSVSRLEVQRHGQTQDQLVRSARAPVGGFAAAPAVLRGESTLVWSAADADGDPLTYSVQYSPDGGKTMVPVAVSVTGSQVLFNADQLPASPNGFLRLLITDGLNMTTVDQVVTVVSSV